MEENQKKVITIQIPVKLDTQTVDAFQDSLALPGNRKRLSAVSGSDDPDAEILLDFDKTNIISSIGFRLLISILRQYPHIRAINVGRDIYDLMDMTGITSLMQVKRKPLIISPVGGDPIARGSNGEIFKIGEDTIVKMFTSRTPIEAIESEWNNAKIAFMLGVPSVICYSLVTDGSRMGIMFEKVKTTSLDQLIYSDYENFSVYAGEFASLLISLHRIHDKQRLLPDVKEIYYDLLGRADYLSGEEKEGILSVLHAIPEGDRVLHGDFHPRNIGEAEGELILFDMAEVSFGNPVFDFISTYYDLVLSGQTVGKDHPEITKLYFGLEPKELKILWDTVLRVYFGNLTEKEIDFINETMDMLVGMKVILFPVLHPNFPAEKLNNWIHLGREHFIRNIPEILERIGFFGEELYLRSGL